MKKLLFFISLALGTASFGQDIEIRYEGVPTPSPSATIDGIISSDYYFRGYYLVNITDAELSLTWSRHDLASRSCLSEQVCTDENCYVPFGDDAIFNSPEPATIAAGDSIYFKVGASSSDVACCAIYKYYIYTGIGVVQDSIDIKYIIGGGDCFLGAEEESMFESIAYPNPASDVFNIVVQGAETAKTELVLFNVVGEELTNITLKAGTNELNVNSFPNGVYFYTIKQGNNLIETKKLIIRH